MNRLEVKRFYPVSGFTLIELMVSIALMALMAGYFVYNRMDAMKEQLAKNIAQQILTIGNKASEYYASNTDNQWPDNDSSTPDCQSPVAVLSAKGYLPADYQVPTMLTFSCQSLVGGIASAFVIKADFGGDRDTANLLAGMLPMATVDETSVSGHVLVTYMETPPRILGQGYHFKKVRLGVGAKISVDKPSCSSGNASYIAIPQSICSSSSLTPSTNFVGYEFKEYSTSNADNKWHLQLLQEMIVPNGVDTNGNPQYKGDWTHSAPTQCNGDDVYIGVITYCGS